MADAQQIITDEVNRLNRIARSLEGLASAFHRTGNPTVAEELGVSDIRGC